MKGLLSLTLLILLVTMSTNASATSSREISLGEFHANGIDFRFLDITIKTGSIGFYVVETLPPTFEFLESDAKLVSQEGNVITMTQVGSTINYKVKIPTGVWSETISGKISNGDTLRSVVGSEVGFVKDGITGQNLPVSLDLPKINVPEVNTSTPVVVENNNTPQAIVTAIPPQPIPTSQDVPQPIGTILADTSKEKIIAEESFRNTLLIWGTLIIIILIGGIFGYKMLRSMKKRIINEIVVDIKKDNTIYINGEQVPQSADKFSFDYEIKNNSDVDVNAKSNVVGNLKKVTMVTPSIFTIKKKDNIKISISFILNNKNHKGKIRFIQEK